MPAIEDVQMEDAALDEIDTDATKKIDDCEETEGKIQREHRGQREQRQQQPNERRQQQQWQRRRQRFG